MKKILLSIGLILPFNLVTLYSQDLANKVTQESHIYIPTPYMRDEIQVIENNTYVKWVLVDSIGIFHSSKKRFEPKIPDKKLEPWDSLYYANQGRLTFYFRESFQKSDTLYLGEPYIIIAGARGVFINGKKEGLWKKTILAPIDGEYDSRIVVEESYKNGLLHGERIIYQLNGEKLRGTIFVDGTGNYYGYYYDSGKIAVDGFLAYGKRHGKWTYYDKEGSVIKEENYKHGLLHGPFTIYGPSGNIIYETIFRDGNGEYRHYKDEVLKMAGQMTSGNFSEKWEFVHLTLQFYEQEPKEVVNIRTYNKDSPENDPSNIIDEIFYEGEFFYLRATRDEKGKSTD